MDHVLITRRLTKLPSAVARPFVWFATLFMSGVIAGLHLMSGLRRFRPGGSDQPATTEQAPVGLAAIGLADPEQTSAEPGPVEPDPRAARARLLARDQLLRPHS